MDTLDIYAQLNIEMDTMAKSFLQRAKVTKRYFTTIHEPWALWIEGCKVGQEIDSSIYDIVHAPDARSYWANKIQVNEEVIMEVNWPAIQDAAATSTLEGRTFITKHASGMCGVGKFMVRWKQRESTACPRCGEFEDSAHVWWCHGGDTDQVWLRSLARVKDWMTQQDTDPDLADLLLSLLQSWRDDTPLNVQIPYSLQLLVDRQLELGGQAILEGRLPLDG
jgi:hypothetical protein